MVAREHRRHLHERLDHQHAGHHRIAGEVSLEERFVDGDVLQGASAQPGLVFDHPVDEQPGIAVRQ
jgi:hypothetical protein